MIDLSGSDLVLDLTNLGNRFEPGPVTSAAAGGGELPTGDEFWTARAALLEGPGRRVDPLALLAAAAAGDGDQPGDLFWRTRAALAGRTDGDPTGSESPGSADSGAEPTFSLSGRSRRPE